MRAWPSFALATAVLAAPAVVTAAEASSSATLDVEIGVVSDYRFRGLSLSDRKPAVQAGVTAVRRGGGYASIWGSSIEEYGAGEHGRGAKTEVDFALGWARSLGALDIDASAQFYTYPGGTGVNYVEFPLSLSRAFGAWRWTIGGAYAPSQAAIDQHNAYGWFGVTWETSALAVDMRAGYEDGAYAPDGKWDWSVSVRHDFGPVTAGLAYVGRDRPAKDPVLVASLSATF